MLSINNNYQITFKSKSQVGNRVVDRLDKALSMADRYPNTHKVYFTRHNTRICIERNTNNPSSRRIAEYDIASGNLTKIKRPLDKSERYGEIVTYAHHGYYRPGYKIKERKSLDSEKKGFKMFKTLQELLQFLKDNNIQR